ncbi:hypothetical protein [Plantactinospora endophytica]|uniref:hypothetical protein n=1 Tax=Plantactinospora endophytica TaxID=673535 RepID=UPI001945A325|nr:hypothetical protein [Plantactinospora endophytica]
MTSHEMEIVSRYVDAGEKIRLAFSAYTGGGLGRRVVGVTTHRLVVVKSGYASVGDKGLLWTEPLDNVALKDNFSRWHTGGVYTGNSYVTVRRGDGSTVQFNPRSSFWGGRGAADANIAALYSAVPGRF